jgi:hypothetical protein
MARKPSTPRLEYWLAECDRYGLQWHKPLAKEVRALKAVARAAERLIVRRPGHFIVRDGIQYAKPLRDALSRLDRLSGKDPR